MIAKPVCLKNGRTGMHLKFNPSKMSEMTTDPWGLTLSGADPAQAAAFDAVVRDYFDHRLSAYPALKTLCEAAPDFAMAHLLKGFLLLSMGSRDTVAAARACHRHVGATVDAVTAHERIHWRALDAWARGDTEGACDCWDEALCDAPRDLLAFKLQHFALFWLGDAARMRDASERVLPAWDERMYGYAHLLGMAAFALEETGDYAQAERLGREAVERHPDDLWALHSVAHVYEMQGRLTEGIAWLERPLDHWDDRNPFKGHLWWHAAMFALEKGEFDRVLSLYDAAVRPAESDFYLDIQNSVSLLARLEFAGVKVGARWDELADAAQNRHGDHVLLFTEPHCAMALGRTGRFEQAALHLASLRDFARDPDISAARWIAPVVAPLCAAIGDFYRGDFAAAAAQMTALRDHYQPIGGSHTQRDVFECYLIDAAVRAGDLPLGKALLSERVSRRGNSYVSWNRYAEVCAQLGDAPTAEHARAQCERIAGATGLGPAHPVILER